MKDLLFSSKGRINRSRFWVAALGISLGLSALLAIVLAILWQLIPGTVDEDGTFKVNGSIAIPYIAAILAYGVVTVWSGICLGNGNFHVAEFR